MFSFLAKSRASELQEELQELKSDFRRLRIEWEEVLESLERRAASLRARERAERAKMVENTPETEAAPAEATTTGGRLLTPKQMQIQQQILARRAGFMKQ